MWRLRSSLVSEKVELCQYGGYGGSSFVSVRLLTGGVVFCIFAKGVVLFCVAIGNSASGVC